MARLLARAHGLPRRLLLVALVLMISTIHTAQGQGLPGLPNISTFTTVPGQTATSAAPTSKNTGNTSKVTGTNTPTSTATGTGTSTGTSASSTATYSAPPLIVPDTAAAPFMQRSNLPEGTVFICVGAVLGFLGASVLAWRALVAWSLHRSVRRAASRTYASETKSSYRGSRYPSMYDASSVSLEHLAATKTIYDGASADEGYRNRRHSRRHSSHRQSRSGYHSRRHSTTHNSRNASRNHSRHTSRVPAGASSLFFSPTAAGMQNAQTRASNYLPPGFYASGISAAAGGVGITSIGGPTGAGYISMDNSHTLSPPVSPGIPPTDSNQHQRAGSRFRDSSQPTANPFGDRPRGSGMTNMPNTSNGSLSVPHSRNPSAHLSPSGRSSITLQGNQRTPSTYLDDVLSSHGSAMGER